MPIGFILYGVFLILIGMNMRGLLFKFRKLILFLSVLFVVFSYLFDYVLVRNVYINHWQLIGIFCLVLYFICLKSNVLIRYLLVGLILMFIDVRLQVDNFSYGIFDLSILFDSFIVYYVLNFVFDKIANGYFDRRLCFEKKCYICFDYGCYY